MAFESAIQLIKSRIEKGKVDLPAFGIPKPTTIDIPKFGVDPEFAEKPIGPEIGVGVLPEEKPFFPTKEIPTRQESFEEIKQRLLDKPSFFAPTEKVRTRDIIREIPMGAKDIGIDIAQSIARSFVATSQGLFNLATGKEGDKFIPKTELQKKIFGTDQPVDFESIGRETADIIGKGENINKPTAMGLGLVMASLDIIPGFGASKKGIIASAKNIAKLNKVDDIFKVLKNVVKGEDNAIRSLAEGLAKETDALKIEKVLNKVKDTPVVKPIKEIEIKPKIEEKVIPTKERKFVTSVKKELPDLPKVAGQYTPRSTDELAIKASNLIKDDIATAEKLAARGTDEKAIATASELLKHYSIEAKRTSSPALQEAIYEKAAKLANETAAKLTEQGRAVQAASILSRLTPEGQVKFAAREIQRFNSTAKLKNKIPELTGKQAKEIIDEMKAIEEITDDVQKAMRFQKLQEKINSLVPTPLMKKVSSIWKAGLLTGLKTTGLNIFANISHFGSEIVKDVPAAVVDSVSSLFTGKRTLALTSAGVKGGIKEGFQKGTRYLRTGFDERNIAEKLDWKKVNFSTGKIAKGLQKYEQTVFRVLGAEDQPFYYGAKARSIFSQANAQAINKGLKGAERSKFVDNLVKNPTDEMLQYSVKDAETAVFQNKTVLGDAAKAIQNIGGGAGEFIVPFGRTPSAVATQIINYTPAGIATTIFKNIGKGNFDQRLFSQGLGRGLTGTAVMAIGASLFDKGMITLDRTVDERERKLWELEGRKPNSILINGKWRSAHILGPAGNVLLVGSHFKNAFKESGSPTKAMADGIFGSLKSFTEQTFLTGINQFLNAATNPERSAGFLASSFIGSAVPTIISDIARAKDTKERRSEKLLDYAKSRIPFLRETLEPKVTVLGKELDRIGNPLEVMIDPTRPSKEIVTPLISELRRLSDEGFKVSPTLLGDRKGYEILTPKENTELWKRAGEIINSKANNLIVFPKYEELDDEGKAKQIDSFVRKAKTIARAEMVLKLTDGLSGDELRAKLSELKTSGLMTNDVFKVYMTIR